MRPTHVAKNKKPFWFLYAYENKEYVNIDWVQCSMWNGCIYFFIVWKYHILLICHKHDFVFDNVIKFFVSRTSHPNIVKIHRCWSKENAFSGRGTFFLGFKYTIYFFSRLVGLFISLACRQGEKGKISLFMRNSK